MKIFCAGAGTVPSLLETGGLYSGLDCFTTYFDMSDRESYVALRAQRPRSVVCDSGTHAYFSATGGSIKSASTIKLKLRLLPPREYVERYARFISETLPFVDSYVEFDTVPIHGRKFQKWQRDCLLEAVGGDRARLMPVYHSCESRRVISKLIDEYPYIGLEGRRSTSLTLNDYMQIARACYEKQVKVHVFASVEREFLTSVPIYSSDSSSWSMIYRRGVFLHFNGRSMSPIHRSQIARRFGETLGSAQPLRHVSLHREPIFRYQPLFRTVLEEYEKFANYLTDLWAARGINWN